MQLDLVVSSDSKARFKASVARADARVLAADGRRVAPSDLRISIALDSEAVLDRMIIVQVVDRR
jgi:hypothetical protein